MPGTALVTGASRPWFDDMSDALSPGQAAEPAVALLCTLPGAGGFAGRPVQFAKVLPWM